MTDKIEELIERLESHMGKQDVPVLLADCRAAAAALRTQRNEVVEECARTADEEACRIAVRYQDHPLAEQLSDIATAIRNLKSQDEPR